MAAVNSSAPHDTVAGRQPLLRVQHLVTSGRAQDRRRFEPDSQDDGGGVRQPHVAHHPRPQLDPPQGRRVLGHRHLVFRAFVDERSNARGRDFTGTPLEIGEIQIGLYLGWIHR